MWRLTNVSEGGAPVYCISSFTCPPRIHSSFDCLCIANFDITEMTMLHQSKVSMLYVRKTQASAASPSPLTFLGGPTTSQTNYYKQLGCAVLSWKPKCSITEAIFRYRTFETKIHIVFDPKKKSDLDKLFDSFFDIAMRRGRS